MLTTFLAYAALSPARQRVFRTLVGAHVFAVALVAWLIPKPAALGQTLLIAGILEGALLIGWRLTQLPKSQALEFLLVSPVRPHGILIGEATVGICFLALVTMTGLPILALRIGDGALVFDDLPALLGMPFLWGIVTGLGLAAWAYEPHFVRKIGERVSLLLLLAYLGLGVLAGEHLPRLISATPPAPRRVLTMGLELLFEYNPFAVMQFAMEQSPGWAWRRVSWLLWAGLGIAALLLVRLACRLHGHFHDEHYRPIALTDGHRRPVVGTEPLTWWAVKRVSRYAGRINVWLALGVGILYASYILFESSWPDWLGTQSFLMFERMGGVPVLATALVVLASVPAAFQYGLWDSNVHDRCRRLELLLLTHLDGSAYWRAAATAAWRRGRGYFAAALLLWGAATCAGRLSPLQFTAALTSATLLWSLYFALGFRAFARGVEANQLGLILTLLLPLGAFIAHTYDWSAVVTWFPPGAVYQADPARLSWTMPMLAMGGLALYLAHTTQSACISHLRRWYDLHHGAKS